MVLSYIQLGCNLFLNKISRIINYPLVNPVNLTLSITNECYSKCKTCNIWKIHKNNPNRIKKELTSQEWKEILKKIGKTPIWITITGGETFLRKDLVDIVKNINLYNKPKFLNIASSGLYPKKTLETTKKILESIDINTKLTINLSVDEIEEKYEKIRGIKGFKKVQKTFFLLKNLQKTKTNLIIGTNIVLSKYNYKRVRQICEYLIDKWDPDSLVCELGEERNAIFFTEDIKIPLNEYLKNIKYIKKLKTQSKKARIISFFRKRYYSLLIKNIIKNKKSVNCYAGYASSEISCHGEVWNCAVKAESFGNLRKNNYDFGKIWKSKKAQKIRKSIKETKCFCSSANPNYTNMLCNFYF